MDRVWTHHDTWEDYRAGLFNLEWTDLKGGPCGIDNASRLLSDPERFMDTAREMIRDWPTSALVNLSGPGNRQAWVGQASCCYAFGVPSFVTKAGWWTMTDDARIAANRVADIVIAEWEREQSNAETLFG